MPKPTWAMAQEIWEDELLARLFSFKETAKDRKYGPYGYVGASRLDKATHDAVMMAHYLAGDGLVITQGGLNGGLVATSAQTHDGLGVVDTSRNGMSMAEAFEVVKFGQACGIIGFIRGVAGYDNMVSHIHWVLVDAKSIQHWTTAEQIYNKGYGYVVGGGGLAGASAVRWYGPPREGLTTWAKSKYNPKNGWRP